MEKKAVSGITLTLLLLCAIHFAAANSVAQCQLCSHDYESLITVADWWVMFHHDSNHTGYSSSAMPTPLVQHWNCSVNGTVRSSPAIVEGTVFVGSSDKNIYALSAANGSETWKYQTANLVYSSPAVADGLVFVGSGDHHVYALDRITGEHVWNYTTGGAVRSSPAVAGGVVFFGSLDGYVYALDVTTKEEKWKFWTASDIYSSPAVSSGMVFVGASDGRVYALNVTGRYEWHFVTGGAVYSSPAVADGLVFVGSDDHHVYALNKTTGKHVWNFTTGDAVRSSPAVVDGRVYVGSYDNKTYCLDAATGAHIWNFTTGGFVNSSPAVADGKVFAGSCDNSIYVLNATTGLPIWMNTTGGSIYCSPAVAENMLFIGSNDKKVYAFGPQNREPHPKIEVDPPELPILHTVTLDGSGSYDPDGDIVNCTWNLDDGTLIENISWADGKIIRHAYRAAGIYNVTLAVTDSHSISTQRKTNLTWQPVTVNEAWPMYRHDWSHKGNSTCLAPVTNRTLWNMTIGPLSTDLMMYPSPAVVGGTVYVGATNGTVYALNAADGSVIWKNVTGGAIHSSPAVADGMVFIGSDDCYVYALNATNGFTIWAKETMGSVIASPTVAYDRVFIGSEDTGVYAFDKTSGKPIWRFQTFGPGAVRSSPAVADGKVYVGSWDKRVYALNATTSLTTGEHIWARELPSKIESSPTVAYDRVFIGTMDGKIYCLNATHNGSPIWSYSTDARVGSSPAVADGKVFIGSDDGYVYALNATTGKTTGELVWKSQVGSVGWSSPTVAECKVFIGSTNRIYALRKEDGKEAWSFKTGASVDSSPAVLNDTLYVSSKEGMLYAFWNKTHDVAVTGLARVPSQIDISQGVTVNIYMTLENQGSFNETNLNVSAYYFNATHTIIANNTVINLTRHSETTITLLWNTTSVAEGPYTLHGNVTILPDEIDVGDNTFDGGPVNVIVGIHDIGLTNLTSCHGSTVLAQNLTFTVNVTATNEGSFTETFTLSIFWNTTNLINSTTVTLEVGETRIVPLDWNTTGYQRYANYTLSANATRVPGEVDILDNTFADPRDLVMTYPGDINNDKKVDIKDLAAIAILFGVNKPDPRYDPNSDITCDGKIDIKDIATAAINFGYIDPDP